MLQRGDWIVYLFIFLVLVWWLWQSWKKKTPAQSMAPPKMGELVQLIEGEGYEFISGKVKIPLHVTIDARERETALTADGLVKGRGRTYIVLTEKEDGKRLTVRRVRERYLSSVMAFRVNGVLVINADKTRLKQVDISMKSSPASSRLKWALASFLLGVGLTFFWLY